MCRAVAFGHVEYSCASVCERMLMFLLALCRSRVSMLYGLRRLRCARFLFQKISPLFMYIGLWLELLESIRLVHASRVGIDLSNPFRLTVPRLRITGGSNYII